MKAREILGTQAPRAEESPARIDESTSDVDWASIPRLTLRKLNRLRKICELQKLEAKQHQKFVARMYGGNFEESDEKEKEPDSRTPPKSVKPPKPRKPLKPSSNYLDKHSGS